MLPFVTALTTSGFDIRFDRDTGSLLIREAADQRHRPLQSKRAAPIRLAGKRRASKKRRTPTASAVG